MSSLSRSLSLSHTHIHTHTPVYKHTLDKLLITLRLSVCLMKSLSADFKQGRSRRGRDFWVMCLGCHRGSLLHTNIMKMWRERQDYQQGLHINYISAPAHYFIH